MKRLIIVGVMLSSFGLTSALAAQQRVSENDADPNPERVNSVVFKKKVATEEFPLFKETKPKEVKTHNDVIRELSERKKREDERKLKELRKRQEERKRQRLEEERKRKLAEEKSRQHDEIKRTLNIEFSYYIAMCDSGCTGKTATGIDVRNSVYYQGMRVVATDPNVIPTWSIIQFEFDGKKVKAIALDTGGYIKGHKIDMLVGSEKEAWNRGRHVKKVEVLRYGK